MTTPMCNLSVKKTRCYGAHPLASRDSFRERCQGAPSGCAVFFVAHEYAPDFTQVKASSKGVSPLDAVPIQVQLGRRAEIFQVDTTLFSASTESVYIGTSGVRRSAEIAWLLFFAQAARDGTIPLSQQLTFPRDLSRVSADIPGPLGNPCRAARGPGYFWRA